MRDPVKILVNKYGWIHLSLGLLGNITFLAGSVLFLPDFQAKTAGTWLFIAGAALMLIGSLGRFLVDMYAGDWHGSNYDDRNREHRSTRREARAA